VDLQELDRELRTAMRELDPAEQRLGIALYRLLAEGEPVDPRRLGDGAAKILAGWPNMFYDDEGRVVAFGGLAIPEMPHRLHLDGRTLHAWCAWDTLFLPHVLGRELRVESRTPGTDEVVTLTVAPEGYRDVTPPGAVLSFVRPPEFDADVIRSFCHHIHFFPTREAGERWTAAHESAFVLTLNEGFELGRSWVEARFGAALHDSD
jgi:alkylmercury lyase